MGRLFDFIDKYAIVRRIVLGVAIWMTWRVSEWAMSFAVSSTRPGVDLAAVVAAVTAPVTVFGGYAFKVYADSKGQV